MANTIENKDELTGDNLNPTADPIPLVDADGGAGSTPKVVKIYPKEFTKRPATGGNTPRYMEDRFADVFNAKDYGATGDGVADDAPALQAAIDAAEAVGGKVVIPSGTYLLNTGLHMQEEGIVIEGMGRDVTGATTGTVLKAGAAISVFNCSQVDYVLATATDALTVPFYFALAAHVIATATDASGNDTALVEDTDYTLTGAGESSGGTLTMIGGTVGERITIRVSTAAVRRATIRDLVLDGSGVGKVGVSMGSPKIRISNVTIRGFVTTGVRCSSFSTLVEHCDVIENTGHGLTYDSSTCNDTRIVGGSISGNSKHGVWVDTTNGYPNGIFLRDINMENNAGTGDASTPYAHVYLGGGVEGAFISGCYHESDNDQTGYASNRFYRIGAGAKNVTMANCSLGCAVGDELDYFIEVESACYPVMIRDTVYNNVGTACIKNTVGASGAIYCDNVTKLGDTGFQADLVDYAGAATTAGQGLTVTPNRAIAAIYKNSDQAVASASMNDIQFASSKVDASSLVTGGSYGLTVKEEGYYRIVLQASCYNGTAGEIAKFQVLVDGTARLVLRLPLPVATSLQTGLTSAIVHADAGDLIKAQVAKSTNNFDVFGSDQYTFLEIEKVGVDVN